MADNFLSKIEVGGVEYLVKDAALKARVDAFKTAVQKDFETTLTDSDNNLPTGKAVKAYVDAQVGAIHNFDIVVLNAGEELPTAAEGTMFKIYLKPDTSAEAGIYVEYITVKTIVEEVATYSWEAIGSTKTDLTDYLTKAATVAGVAFGDDKAISVEELSGADALNLKALSHKDSAEGSLSTIDSITMDEVTVAGNATVTTTATDITSAGTFTAAGTVAGTVVPTGSISVTLKDNAFKAVDGVGTLPSVTEANSDFATAGVVVKIDETDSEKLVISAASTAKALTSTGFSAGTLPTTKDVTVAVDTQTFTGNATGDAINATFTGTADQAISVKGSYDKADATAAYSVKVTPTVKEYTKTSKTVTVQ